MSDNYKTEHTISQLRNFDKKINAKRARIKSDPDDAFDKLLKFALPAITGLIIGQITSLVWKQGKKRVLPSASIDDSSTADDGIIASMLFAAFSAAVGSLATSLSNRGSQKIVDARHHRQMKKRGRHRR